MSSQHWSLSVTAEDKRIYPIFAFVRLHQAVEHNVKLLRGGHDTAHLNYVAWLTRNLLELRIWVAFCVLSEQNAVVFFEDAARDLIDLNRKNDTSDAVFRQELASVAKTLSPDRLPHKMTWASDAADAVGMREMFEINNKLLSKFVHPTAMSVCAPIQGEGADGIIQRFVALGLELGNEAVQTLDSSYLKPLYDRYEATIIKVQREHPQLDFVLPRA